MARIRTVKPAFFRHLELFEAEQESRLPLRIAFEALWCCADREGRFAWKPRELKLDCLPYDDLDFAKVLAALAKHGFIVAYEVAGKKYAHIPSFAKHQVINQREAASDLPAPDDVGAVPCAHVHAHGEEEGKGREQEGEGKGNGQSRADARPPVSEAFGLWNSLADEIGLSGADKLTASRRSLITGRLRDLDGIEGWQRLLAKVRDSPFLRGEQNGNGHARWRATLDFVIKEGNCAKIMEGQYDDRDGVDPATIKAEVEAILAREGLNGNQ